MSVSVEQARRSAVESLRQDAQRCNEISDSISRHLDRANAMMDETPGVINLRPLRGERAPYDANAEQRQLAFDAYGWTLITIGLRGLTSQTAHELADQIEERLKHPSTQVAL